MIYVLLIFGLSGDVVGTAAYSDLGRCLKAEEAYVGAAHVKKTECRSVMLPSSTKAKHG